MNRFGWLLRREWMQHHRGWLILAIVPAVIVLAGMPFSTVQTDEVLAAPMLASMGIIIYMMAMMVLALGGVLFDAPGLARRDQQDRSIEFWLSLPTSHLQSVSAICLTNLLLMPLVVLLISAVVAQGVAALLVVRVLGVPALGELAPLPWLGLGLAALLRQAVGLVLGLLWLSPLIMLVMAASTWLRGWAVPAVATAFGFSGLALQQLTGHTLIWDVLLHWWRQANVAVLPLTRGGLPFSELASNVDAMPLFASWMVDDIGRLLRDAASPMFVAALLVALAGFAILVWRRPRMG